MKLFLNEDEFQAAGDKEPAAIWRCDHWLDFPPKFVSGITNPNRPAPEVLANQIDLTPLASVVFARAANPLWQNSPKPATVEPPVWKGREHNPMTLASGTVVCANCDAVGFHAYTGFCPGQSQVRRGSPLTPYGIALEAFIERRKAKRERLRAEAFDDRMAENLKKFSRHDDALARAMQEPVTFTARLGGR